MTTARHDFLIIGQGLAGSLLAWRLIQAGRRVLVIDDGHRSAASKVAAGLVNPLAGLRFNHSPRVHPWLDELERLYGEIGRAAGRPFFHPQPMVRLFRSPQQARFYDRNRTRPGSEGLFGECFGPEASGQPVHAPHGGFHQHHTGHLDLPGLLRFMTGWLEVRGALRRQAIDHTQIRPETHQVTCSAWRAGHLIFCEGYRAIHNPWFGHLPFAPDKGEFLVLAAAPGTPPGRLPDTIVNGAHWLLPHADGRYRLGATHDHHHFDQRPTPEGRQTLTEGMQRLLRHPEALRLVDHQAGVRPATADRKPFLGDHPHWPRLHIFNGFGAHGSLQIPWYSRRMAEWLLHGRPLPAEADLAHRAGC